MNRFVTVVALVLSAATPAALAQSNCSGISAAPSTTLTTVVAVDGLTQHPLFVTSPPADVNRIFVVEQAGYVRIHKRGDAPGTISTFLDRHTAVNSSGNEMGLLGLAFPPDYATTGQFFVDFTESNANCTSGIASVVSRFTVSGANPDLADVASEVRLLALCQPETNHNGGWLAFGPDGYLYIATGDGGGAGDNHGTCGNAQGTTTLLGKLLRIDVRNQPNTRPPDCGGTGALYRVPNDNPLANGPGGACDEIWSWGLRNPWRNSFDSATGDLYVGDVGQSCWEEVDVSPAAVAGRGVNFGWRQMEGRHCYNPGQTGTCSPQPAACAGSPACNDPSLALPVIEIAHSGGVCAVIGGYVYRGCRMPSLRGTYFYGDDCAGTVKSFVHSGGAATNAKDWTAQLDPTGSLVNNFTSFGTDARGEIYLTDRSGRVLLVAPPLPALEASGPGASSQLRVGKTSWNWEDIGFNSGHPVSAYRVYRGRPNQVFSCIARVTSPSWTGDTAVPSPGTQFAYLVTAINAAGQETSPGAGTAGTPARQLSAATCP